MIFKNFADIKLSALGMGCMRLPVNDKNEIDIDKTAEMVDYAMKNGVNYYDTAWGYHGGMSETVMGEVLSKYPRESFYLASKFPGYDLSNMDKIEQIFEKQLEKCRVEYFDFYLFHNLCELNVDAYLDSKYDLYGFLMEQKKKGKIKHLGFSAHGSIETINRFLDAYGKDMEFCQLQINWLDWKFQDADKKVEIMKQWGIPVWVMEPVRGGKLCSLAPAHEARLAELDPECNMPRWAFRFIQSIPEVVVTLSGMSNFDQLKENIDTFSVDKPLSKKEFDTLLQIGHEMTHKNTLPCTACRYCTDHCPMELDIPNLIELYNEHVYSDGGFIAPMALDALDDSKKPSACIGCRSCEAVCPQNIKISEMMTDFTAKLR